MSAAVHRIFVSPWINGIEPRGADIHSIARGLLKWDGTAFVAGQITPDTRLEVWSRSVAGDRDILRQSGIAGELAKWAVVEAKGGNPAFGLRRWRPFPASTSAAGAVEPDFEAQCSVELLEAVSGEEA
jgi:hypothetical protein